MIIKKCFCLQNGIYDESVGSFFRNVDSRYENASDIPFGQGQGKIKSLKARVSKIYGLLFCVYIKILLS